MWRLGLGEGRRCIGTRMGRLGFCTWGVSAPKLWAWTNEVKDVWADSLKNWHHGTLIIVNWLASTVHSMGAWMFLRSHCFEGTSAEDHLAGQEAFEASGLDWRGLGTGGLHESWSLGNKKAGNFGWNRKSEDVVTLLWLLGILRVIGQGTDVLLRKEGLSVWQTTFKVLIKLKDVRCPLRVIKRTPLLLLRSKLKHFVRPYLLVLSFPLRALRQLPGGPHGGPHVSFRLPGRRRSALGEPPWWSRHVGGQGSWDVWRWSTEISNTQRKLASLPHNLSNMDN